MSPRQADARWHVGREIPIALIVALFLQTGGWVWWAATQSAKLDTLTNMVSDFKASQYTVSDARRDAESHISIHNELARRVGVLESQLLYKQKEQRR